MWRILTTDIYGAPKPDGILWPIYGRHVVVAIASNLRRALTLVCSATIWMASVSGVDRLFERIYNKRQHSRLGLLLKRSRSSKARRSRNQ